MFFFPREQSDQLLSMWQIKRCWLKREIMENLTYSTMPELRAMGQANSLLSAWLVKTLPRLPNI